MSDGPNFRSQDAAVSEHGAVRREVRERPERMKREEGRDEEGGSKRIKSENHAQSFGNNKIHVTKVGKLENG